MLVLCKVYENLEAAFREDGKNTTLRVRLSASDFCRK